MKGTVCELSMGLSFRVSHERWEAHWIYQLVTEFCIVAAVLAKYNCALIPDDTLPPNFHLLLKHSASH